MSSPIIELFAYEHLSPKLQEISKPFTDIAKRIDEIEPTSQAKAEQKAHALQYVMLAKDAAVKAAL